jgi:hypothetical protein
MELLTKKQPASSPAALATTPYEGLFVRSALNQQNSIPRTGAQSSSPDIIPNGIAPLPDPYKTLVDDYNKDIGKKLEAGKTNYIYMRAKNFSSDRIVDDTDGNRPRLFWTKASLLSYPNKWNEITQTPSHNKVSIAADPGAIGVMSEPMVWVPDNISGDHYCMIGMVPSPGYKNDPPNTLQISDFAAWVSQYGGVGWRNVEVVNHTTTTLTGSKLYYEQGDEAALMEFYIICENVPLKTKISFSAGAPGPVPPIFLNPTEVSTFPNFTVGMSSNVPKGYVSDIYFNLEAPPGVTDLSNAKVTIRANYAPEMYSRLWSLGHTRAELGMPTPEHAYGEIKRQLEARGESTKLTKEHDQYLQQLTDLHVKAGPVRLVVVGANSWEWKK